MVWVLIHLPQVHNLICFIGIVVICSGLGRLYSKIKVGSGGKYLESIMYVEITLGIAFIVLEYLR
jgi:hypothetical protein